MKRFALVVSALALCSNLGPPAIAASEADVPAALRSAVKTLAAERHGIIAFHRHFSTDRRAPGNNQRTAAESARVVQDGHTVNVKLYQRTTDGVAATAEDLATRQAALEKSLPGDDYTLPVTEKLLADYQFGTPSACAGCDRGVVAIPFTSLKRDDNHGDGTVYVDESARHILRFEFKPSVNPKEVDSGEILVTFGRATSDLWDVVTVKQRYGGHRLFIRWSYETVATHTAYRRFDSLDEARAALASGA
jgi:hypothetical protein